MDSKISISRKVKSINHWSFLCVFSVFSDYLFATVDTEYTEGCCLQQCVQIRIEITVFPANFLNGIGYNGCSYYFQLKMYLMYVDESGDPGLNEGSSAHYILAALVIHHTAWEASFERLKQFRKQVQQLYGLGLHTEIHATELIRIKKQETYKIVTKKQRINILASYANCLTEIFPAGSLITIHLDKSSFCSYKSINEAAWQKLLIKYHHYLQQQQESGMVIADEGNETTLRYLLRNLRREKSLHAIIEDFSHRSSKCSYFIQTVDVIAFLLFKKMYPKGAAKKYNLDLLFDRFSSLVLESRV